MEKILTKEELTNVITNRNNVILKFSAEWCQPCKLLGSIINDVIGEYNDVNFVECDVDDVDEELIKEYDIKNVPVMIFFQDGFQIDKTIGMIGREKLIEKLNKHYGK